MKSLVIVGNAPIASDLSSVIDAFDYVVRFNNCKNYALNSGRKTDLLVLNCTPVKNNTIRFFLDQEAEGKEIEFLTMAKQVWFIRPNSAFFHQHFSDLLTVARAKKSITDMVDERIEILETQIGPTLKHVNADVAEEIISARNIPRNKVTKIDEAFYMDICHKLDLNNANSVAIMPSTGMLGIEMILHDKKFSDFDKYIVGFTWQGWKGHPWKKEKEVVQHYIDKGILKVLI